MIFKTLTEVTQGVLTELGLVTGSAVQVYTEPQIEDKIRVAFDTLAGKRFWDELTKTSYHTLDGTVGVVVDDDIGINSPTDIQWVRVYPYYESDKVRNLKGQPYVDQFVYAYDALPFDDPQRATKLLQFYPKSLALTVAIRARRKFTIVNGDSIVPFDYIAIQHYVTFLLLSNDGINPSEGSVQMSLFDQRYKDLISDESNEVQYYGTQRDDTFTVAE